MKNAVYKVISLIEFSILALFCTLTAIRFISESKKSQIPEPPVTTVYYTVVQNSRFIFYNMRLESKTESSVTFVDHNDVPYTFRGSFYYFPETTLQNHLLEE